MLLDQRAFRHALGHFPTGVVVVTAENPDGDPIAMTVSSFNAVSLDPPLVLFSIGKAALSLPSLLAAGHFGISVLRGDQSDMSGRFATARGAKWAGLQPARGATGCPLIGPCLASFECDHYATYEGGDHVIIVGRVLQFELASEGEPLVFFRGAYHALANLQA
jgi:flavin reductase (DIM6/NTAB) family NADH-FMN oxidoreductase RutF